MVGESFSEFGVLISSAKGNMDTCVQNPILNLQLRVEEQVLVAVKDKEAADFGELTHFETLNIL